MTGYKMNFATKTLTITKAFAALAMRPNTAEANLLAEMKALFPDLKLSYRTHYSGKPHPYKGLTYKKMETYISLHENAAELMEAFETVKTTGRVGGLDCFFGSIEYQSMIPYAAARMR